MNVACPGMIRGIEIRELGKQRPRILRHRMEEGSVDNHMEQLQRIEVSALMGLASRITLVWSCVRQEYSPSAEQEIELQLLLRLFVKSPCRYAKIAAF
jgi:hypothetical protein